MLTLDKRQLVIWGTILLLSVVLIGALAGAGGALLAQRGGRSSWSFARYTADDAIRAFNQAGLRTDNPQPLPANSIYAADPFNVEHGRMFTVGAVPPTHFYILEFDSEEERDAVWDRLAANKGRFPHRFYVKGNLIFVSRLAENSLATRYETVLAGMR
jgi:hypothetical protein